MRFQDKVALITGGAQGIGEAIVKAFARENATVVIADIQIDRAMAVADEARSLGGRALAIKMDVTDYSEVSNGVSRVLEEYGRIDILVNNAGFDMPGDFLEQDEQSWDRSLSLNLKGPMIVSSIVLRSMIEKRFGRIVNISSEAGRTGAPFMVAYAAAKGGVIALTRSLARAYAKYNIRVNSIAPGPTETPALKGALVNNPGLRDLFLQSRPIQRFGRPEDVAAAVLFLASDKSEYITGQTLNVDGGGTMS